MQWENAQKQWKGGGCNAGMCGRNAGMSGAAPNNANQQRGMARWGGHGESCAEVVRKQGVVADAMKR